MPDQTSYIRIQRYDSEAHAKEGQDMLLRAAIEAQLETIDPGTVFTQYTPGTRAYLLKVPADKLKQAHQILYRQEPVERPEKDWQFRDKSVRASRKAGLRNLMLGAALACASMAIGLATYLLAEGPHYLMAAAAFAGSIFLIAKGWRQLRRQQRS